MVFNLLSLLRFSLSSEYMKASIEFKIIIKLLRRKEALLALEVMSYNLVRKNPAETKGKNHCVLAKSFSIVCFFLLSQNHCHRANTFLLIKDFKNVILKVKIYEIFLLIFFLSL